MTADTSQNSEQEAIDKILSDGEDNMSSWFSDHPRPNGSIEVRVHTLDNDKNSQLEEFMVRTIPDCYISESDLTARMNETGLSASEILQT